MSEQIENQVILDAVQATPEAVETVSPQGEDNGEDQGEQGAEEQYKPKVNGVQKRINKFVKTLAEQGEENRRLRAELESLRQGQSNQQPKDEKPNHQHYNDINAYEKDLIDWNTRQLQSKYQSQQTEPSRNQVDYAEEQRVNTWKSRVDELAKTNPRINEITSDELYFIDAFPAIGQVVKESVNPELVLHLVDNPQLIEDLHDLSPIQVARELGKIEASLKKPVLRKQSNAVAPISPVKGNGAVAKADINKMSMDDYYRDFNKRQGS